MYRNQRKESYLPLSDIITILERNDRYYLVKSIMLRFKMLAKFNDNSKRILSVEFLYLAVRNEYLLDREININREYKWNEYARRIWII